MDFSIILASRERPQLLSNLVNSIHNTTANLDCVEMLVGIDDDDAVSHTVCEILKQRYPFFQYYSRPRSNMLNRDYLNWLSGHFSSGKYVIVCNDDTEFVTPNWDEIICSKLTDYLKDKPDGIVYGYISDALIDRNGMAYCCFPLVSRAGVLAMGCTMPPEYTSWNADIGLWRIYSAIGRVCDISEVMIKHISYHSGTRDKDHINQHVRDICNGHEGVPFGTYIDRIKAKMQS